jgi:hypothetical protein
VGFVRAQIQTVEEIYRLVWTAVANRQPIESNYEGRYRLFVRTDLAGIGNGSFVYSATNMEARAGVDSTRWVRLQTGIVSNWRNSAG